MTPELKTALVTGASSGLGRGLAAWFAKKGFTVYAAARRVNRLAALKAEVGDAIIPVQLDVCDVDQAHARIAALDESSGGLDLVIANAGIGGPTSAKRLDWPTMKRMLDTNVMGAAATLTAALPGMINRGRGHLVAVSSLARYVPVPKFSAYVASKAFLTSFIEGLRLDVEKLGVAVTNIEPGFVKSEITQTREPKTMPFLMETDDAVAVMGRAIMSNQRQLSFPWQLSAFVQAAAALPQPIKRLAVTRLK